MVIRGIKNQLIVEPVEDNGVTEGGIIYNPGKDKTSYYKVLKVGPMVTDIKKGDVILCPTLSPKFRYENKDYYIVTEDKVWAIRI